MCVDILSSALLVDVILENIEISLSDFLIFFLPELTYFSLWLMKDKICV